MAHVVHASETLRTANISLVHALAIALVNAGDLTLLHAQPGRWGARDRDQFPRIRPRLEKWGLLSPGASYADIAAETGIHVHKKCVKGRDPAASIADAAKDHHADILVIAGHRPDMVRGLHGLSTCSKIARQSAAQVLVIPDGAKGFVAASDGSLTLDRVLVAIDGMPDPDRWVRRALSLLGGLAGPDLTIEFMHASPPEEQPPADMILQRIAAFTPDLLIIGSDAWAETQASSRLTVAEQVLARSRVPVLTVPVD